MDAVKAVFERKSVREYTADQITEEQLNVLTEAALCGPGGAALHISVIQNADLIKRLSDMAKEGMLNSGNAFSVGRASLPGYEPCYGAPTLFLFCSPAGNDASTASCAAENVLIAATALGLGSCYLMSTKFAFVGEKGAEHAKECGIPEGYEFTCGAIVGTKAGDAFASPYGQRNRTINFVK